MNCLICNKEKKSLIRYKDINRICHQCYNKLYRPKKNCDICGKVKIISTVVDEKNICPSCYNKQFRLQKSCSVCKNVRVVHKTIDNKPICNSCYSQYYRPKVVCSICGKESVVGKIVDNNKVCTSCYQKYYRPKRICSNCGKNTTISKVLDNKYFCDYCYRKLFRIKRQCSLCNKLSIIDVVDGNKDICSSCYDKYYRPRRMCSACGNISRVVKIIDGKDICLTCYRRQYQPKENCSICGKYSTIHKNTENGHVCRSCYTRYYQPKFQCSICGELSIRSKKDDDKSICPSCYMKYYCPRHPCSICGNLDIVMKSQNEKKICPTCYYRNFRHTSECSICKKVGVITLNDGIRKVCNTCYRQLIGTCINCGKSTKHFFHSKKLCLDCWYQLKVQEVVQQYKIFFIKDDTFLLFQKYAETLIKYRTPLVAYLTLLNHSELFKYIDNNPIEICDLSIEHLTEYRMKYRVSHYNTFENFLLKENVIQPLTSEELLKKFLGKLANTLQAHFSIVLTSYSEYLLNKQKALRKHGHLESFKIETLINYCTIARNFLQVISHSIESIHEITDIDVDKYLQSNPSHNMALRNFIKWLNNSISIFSKLRLPYCNSISNKISIIDNEDLFKVIESLSSPGTPYKEKVIGFLLLFYAIRPSESREIKLEHYTKDVNDSYLFIRKTNIKLHPFVSTLIDNYIAIERSDRLSLSNHCNWLFPGKHFNKAISLTYMNEILHKHNISSRKSFSTCIVNSLINYNLSPAVIIHSLGINISTIVSYYNNLNMNATFEISNINKNEDIQKVSTNIASTYKYYVYILRCYDYSFYTGYTSDLQKRLQQHQNGTGCTYTKTRTPVELVYTEELPDKPSALKREKQIKKLTIFDKEKLIEKSRAN